MDTSKKIGLLIVPNASFFSSGILQNAYFLYQCFNHMGMKCNFLVYEEDANKKIGHVDLPIKTISLDKSVFDPTEYHTVMTISVSLDKEYYTLLKLFNVHVVGFLCGNVLMHDQENFVRGPLTKSFSYIGKSAQVDQLWVIPPYKHALDYIEVVRGKPAYIIPHVWTPEISSFGYTPSQLMYDAAKHTGKKATILILEPNIAMFKNAVIPMAICDRLNSKLPNLIDEVYVFNFPDHESSWKYADNFSLGSKLRRFKRLAIPEILTHFNTKDTVPIILSYQLYNSLNYLYYEALHYGFPLVHNSPDLDDCGYYYPEHNFKIAMEQILYAFVNHNKSLDSYMTKGKKYLERVDPFNPSVCKDIRALFDNKI